MVSATGPISPDARLSKVGDIAEPVGGDPDTGEELPLCVAILRVVIVIQKRSSQNDLASNLYNCSCGFVRSFLS